MITHDLCTKIGTSFPVFGGAHNAPFGSCSLCCGAGTQHREGEILQKCTHGDSCINGRPRSQTRSCNNHECNGMIKSMQYGIISK